MKRGRFHNVFEDKPTKWPIATKKQRKKKNPTKYKFLSQMNIGGWV